MRQRFEPKLDVQRPKPSLGAWCYGLDRFALGSQPGEATRALGTWAQPRPSCSAFDRWLVDVEIPALATVR